MTSFQSNENKDNGDDNGIDREGNIIIKEDNSVGGNGGGGCCVPLFDGDDYNNNSDPLS